MGIFKILGKIIIFPFKLLFGKVKKKEPQLQPLQGYPQQPQFQQATYSSEASPDNVKAKMDLMMAQIDSLKLEYETVNQRVQNIERMVREIYVMAKS